MRFVELASKRQSDRGYCDEPVDREKIDYCIEAARLAPSACNSQPWRFIVVDDSDLKDRLAKATFGKLVSINHFSVQAPVLVAIVAEKPTKISRLAGVVKNRRYDLMDIGIAAEHFCLAAAEQGLGTCMLGWFDERAVKKMLSVPRGKRVELIITLGYPSAKETRTKKRKTIDEMRGFNRY